MLVFFTVCLSICVRARPECAHVLRQACRCSGLVHTFECVNMSEQSSLGQRGVVKHTLILLIKLYCCHIHTSNQLFIIEKAF